MGQSRVRLIPISLRRKIVRICGLRLFFLFCTLLPVEPRAIIVSLVLVVFAHCIGKSGRYY